ncbi:hypothetical protein IWW37_002364 [Coemansia sp. RSA 2050]|nr:hypothetical protein IWW37_002364 [Coemansia sp. RSA 2050]KAJ2733704.1 hypothetical protein IW152_002887 [Coemansia sp. BCRC 34962]
MEDLRDIPKTAHSTEAERLAAEAAAEAGWRWPRVRMMAQSPDLQQTSEQPQPPKQQKRQRSAWKQVRRFIGEVTEVFDDPAAINDLSFDTSVHVGEPIAWRNPSAWIVAGWVLLMAVDWAMTSTVMPRIVAWASAQPWSMEEDESLAWIQVETVSMALELTRPFAVQWWCFCLYSCYWLLYSNERSYSSKGKMVRGMIAYGVYFYAVEMALIALLEPAPSTPRPGDRDLISEFLQRLFHMPYAGAVEQQERWAQRLRQAAAGDMMGPRAGCWTALFVTAAVYMAAGLRLRAWRGLRLRTTAVLFVADLGLRHHAGATAENQLPLNLAINVISISAILVIREAAVAIQAMRSWHVAVVRERRRGGPLMMQASAARRKKQGSKLVDRLAGGGAYAHRVCFLCLGGFCSRCMLSLEIWPTTPASSVDQTATLLLGSPQDDESDNEALPLSPTRSAVPVLAAGRRRVRKHGRTTFVNIPADATPHNDQLDTLPAFGQLNPASLAPVSGTNRRSLDMWIICSVAHCPCRSVHGPGPSAFVPKSLAARDTVGSRFTLPVGSMVGLVQYAEELCSLRLVRTVDPQAMANTGDFTASVFPYIFGRFAVPEHKGSMAAANALASSWGHSGYTPASAPFLAPTSGNSSSDAAEQPRVSRIIMAATPLSLARSTATTFRLTADTVRLDPDGGCVLVSVAMTPALAHALLSHPKTSPTAAVCVPAALLSPTKPNADTPAVSDADPYLDYARVQVARSDVVVRVDGVRWLHYEFGPLALNQPITLRKLPAGDPKPLEISLTICGMRSEDLYVLIPEAKPVVPVANKDQELVAEAEKEKARLAVATQNLKRTKREAPKGLAHWEAQLEAVRKSLDRNSAADGKLESKRRHLELSVGALRTAIQTLAEEQSGHQSDPELAPDNQAAVDDALAKLHAVESDARQQRNTHTHALEELSRHHAEWTEKLSEVRGKIEPLERTLISQLQKDLKEVSRKFLVSRNVEARLQAKLRKELLAYSAKVYTGSKSSACINVDKAFKKSNTWIFTLGRSVDLYSGANCTKKFYTTKSSSRSTIAYQHSIMSFKVRSK